MRKQRIKNPWIRKGLVYHATINVYGGKTYKYRGTVRKRLNFISYHGIKWYYGEQKLIDMAYDFMEHFKND